MKGLSIVFFAFLLLFSQASPSRAQGSPVLNPQPWCSDGIGGADIYSPEIVQFRFRYRMYFGGWYESCRLQDAIYVASYSSFSGTATNVRPVITPEAAGFLALNDPGIAKLYDPTTQRNFLLMYMTGIKDGDVFEITNNKIYTSTSWADDGINWSVPQLLLDGWWAPGVAQHPHTEHVWLWANSTVTGEFRAFEFAEDGVSLLNSYSMILTPGANYDNADARWDEGLGGWDIVAENINRPNRPIERLFSPDGILWITVEENFILNEGLDYIAITPAWGPRGVILYGHYWTGWPPNLENFMSIWRQR